MDQRAGPPPALLEAWRARTASRSGAGGTSAAPATALPQGRHEPVAAYFVQTPAMLGVAQSTGVLHHKLVLTLDGIEGLSALSGCLRTFVAVTRFGTGVPLAAVQSHKLSVGGQKQGGAADADLANYVVDILVSGLTLLSERTGRSFYAIVVDEEAALARAVARVVAADALALLDALLASREFAQLRALAELARVAIVVLGSAASRAPGAPAASAVRSAKEEFTAAVEADSALPGWGMFDRRVWSARPEWASRKADCARWGACVVDHFDTLKGELDGLRRVLVDHARPGASPKVGHLFSSVHAFSERWAPDCALSGPLADLIVRGTERYLLMCSFHAMKNIGAFALKPANVDEARACRAAHRAARGADADAPDGPAVAPTLEECDTEQLLQLRETLRRVANPDAPAAVAVAADRGDEFDDVDCDDVPRDAVLLQIRAHLVAVCALSRSDVLRSVAAVAAADEIAHEAQTSEPTDAVGDEEEDGAGELAGAGACRRRSGIDPRSSAWRGIERGDALQGGSSVGATAAADSSTSAAAAATRAAVESTTAAVAASSPARAAPRLHTDAGVGAPASPSGGGSAASPPPKFSAQSARTAAAGQHRVDSLGHERAEAAAHLWQDLYWVLTAPAHGFEERLARFREVYAGSAVVQMLDKQYLLNSYGDLVFVAFRARCERLGVDTTAHSEAWHRMLRTVLHRHLSATMAFIFGVPESPAGPDGSGGVSAAESHSSQAGSVVGKIVSQLLRLLGGGVAPRSTVAVRRVEAEVRFASVYLAPADPASAVVPIALLGGDAVRLRFCLARTRSDGSVSQEQVDLRAASCTCPSTAPPCAHVLAAAAYTVHTLQVPLPLLCPNPDHYSHYTGGGVSLRPGMEELPRRPRQSLGARARQRAVAAAVADGTAAPAPVRERRPGTGITQRSDGAGRFEFRIGADHGSLRPQLSGTSDVPHATLNARLQSVSSRAADSLSAALLAAAAEAESGAAPGVRAGSSAMEMD